MINQSEYLRLRVRSEDRLPSCRHAASFDDLEPETQLLGCVYIDPPDDGSPPGTDAVVSWWVVDNAVGTDLERALEELVPRRLAETGRFRSVHYSP